MDFEDVAQDHNEIKTCLLEVFEKDVTQLLLNDDCAAPWAVGFAQGTIITTRMLENEEEPAQEEN
jgi:hypothetical protein